MAPVHRDLRAAAKAATRQGWRVEVARSGHVHWKAPSGQTIYSSRTPSDMNGPRQTLKQLRRAGLAI